MKHRRKLILILSGLASGALALVLAPRACSAAPPTPAEAKTFWAFQHVKRPPVPQVRNQAWVRNPIDAFVLAKLEAKGLAPAPPAEKAALLRRATFDLTGLPPTLAEVEAFVADASPDAYEKVIDRLLASPRYGEKWGRHWLDLVRFAETNSYETDGAKPNAWRYRDYVIRSFNDDKPYDRFIREQIAGDELPDAATNPDDIIATGYYRLGIWDDAPADHEQAKFEQLDDLVDTTSQVFLGLTVGCARCHDHKLDPIPQKDYYRLLAFFHNINPYHNGGPGDEQPILSRPGDKDAFAQRVTERRARRQQTEANLYNIEVNFQHVISGDPKRSNITFADAQKLIGAEGERVLGKQEYEHYRQLKRDLRELDKPLTGVDMALCVTERGPTAPDTFVLARGLAAAPGAKVEPAFLEVLGAPPPVIPTPPPGAKTSGRRTALANWLASSDNPMTARVMANRVFQYHFGRGIVRSPSNFGLQGDKPTHPELLDWLASELASPQDAAQAWQLKRLHRLIMTSSAYRMASEGDDATAAKARSVDPQNDLFWHFDLRRLSAEEVRDAVLAVNGTLNLKMFGPGIYPKIPREVLAGQSRPGSGWGTSTPEEASRRSIYIHVKRSLLVPILEGMDVAEVDKSCPVRFVTVQPTQALGLLNSTFLNEESEKFAARIRREGGDDVHHQVELALRLALCRDPHPPEVERGLNLVKSLREKDGASPEVAMKYFCLMVYNLNEFVYLD